MRQPAAEHRREDVDEEDVRVADVEAPPAPQEDGLPGRPRAVVALLAEKRSQRCGAELAVRLLDDDVIVAEARDRLSRVRDGDVGRERVRQPDDVEGGRVAGGVGRQLPAELVAGHGEGPSKRLANVLPVDAEERQKSKLAVVAVAVAGVVRAVDDLQERRRQVVGDVGAQALLPPVAQPRPPLEEALDGAADAVSHRVLRQNLARPLVPPRQPREREDDERRLEEVVGPPLGVGQRVARGPEELELLERGRVAGRQERLDADGRRRDAVVRRNAGLEQE